MLKTTFFFISLLSFLALFIAVFNNMTFSQFLYISLVLGFSFIGGLICLLFFYIPFKLEEYNVKEKTIQLKNNLSHKENL